MQSDPPITFRRKPARLDTERLEKFARILRREVTRGREFHCLVTGDAEMRLLNTRFRGKKQTTDVLSFPSGLRTGFIGDLAISLGRAREQARGRGHSTEDEVCILMLHGALHLTGLDHETDDGKMRRVEARWRRKLGLPDSLIERAHA